MSFFLNTCTFFVEVGLGGGGGSILKTVDIRKSQMCECGYDCVTQKDIEVKRKKAGLNYLSFFFNEAVMRREPNLESWM